MFWRIIIFAAVIFLLYMAAESFRKNKWVYGAGWAIALFALLLLVHASAVAWSGLLYLVIAFAAYWFIGYFKKNKAHGRAIVCGIVVVVCGLAGFGTAWTEMVMPTSDNNSENSGNTQVIGQPLKRMQVHSHDGYYTSRADSKLRFYTSDGKVSAAKYVFGANHMPVTSVKNELEGTVLNDDNLKYTTDKDKSENFLPDGDSFNVYSPKLKKWYHVSMQRDDDDKVSSFSVYRGKDSDADDY